MNISAQEILQYVQREYTIDLDGVLSEIEKMKNAEYLKQHPYDIWLASDDRWKTYLPDSAQKSGRKMIARKNREDIENALISYYRNQETDALQFVTLYYQWLELKRLTVSNGTIERLHNAYKRFYEQHEISRKKVSSITYKYLKLFLLSTVKKYDMDYKQYCNFSSVLRGVLEYALESELIEQNPFDRFHIGRNTLRSPDVYDKKEQVFTLEERQLLEDTIWEDYKSNPKNTVPLAILLDFYTGLRSGELVSLKWSDIVNQTLSIRRTEISYTPINPDGTKGNVIYEIKDSPKTNAGNRDVILIPKAMKVIQELEQFQKAHNFQNEFLFLDENGERIIRKRLDSKIRVYCKKLNIPVRSMHKIRKYYISALKLANVPDYDIMRQAGHKELTTTLNSYCFSILDDSQTRNAITSAL